MSSQCENKSACPQRMSDGRLFTDYRPRCVSQFATTQSKYNSYEHRQYMINNASSIMQKNAAEAYEKNKCLPCMEPYNVGTMLPEKNLVTCNKQTCSTTIFNDSGFATGINYGSISSSAKNEFIAAKEKESSEWVPCAIASDDPLYYSFDGQSEGCERAFQPSGLLPVCGKK